MHRLAGAAVLFCGAFFALSASASTFTRWIQLGPGSSAAALQSGGYGDQPASLTPTILARALITSRSGGCPSTVLEDGTTLAMNARFDAGTLTNLPLSGTSNIAGYPTSFVANPAVGTFGDGTPAATNDWTVCEAVVPSGHKTATIDGMTLKLPVANPKRILVIADTGCRIAGAGSQQDCHNPSNFPFNYLANYEAQFAPDLVILVGDYFYRDTTCQPGINNYGVGQNQTNNCNSNPTTNPSYTPWGDTFDAWNGDLFFPAANLLEAAPWIMVRGNHESCGRGARGWFAMLDPHPYNINQVKCTKVGSLYPAPNGTAPTQTAKYTGDFTQSYVVPAGPINFIVHDSSFANDSAVDTNMAINYDLDLSALLSQLPSNQFYVYATHKPTYGLVAGGYDSSKINGGDFTEQYTFSGNATANSAFADGVVPPQIAFFLSGHIHEFEYVNFTSNTSFAPQLIVGTGGDNLDYTSNPSAPAQYTNTSAPLSAPNTTLVTNQYATSASPANIDLHTATSGTPTTTGVTNAYAQAEFGFAVLDATATGYQASVYNLGSNRAGRCVITLSPRSIQCWK
jgi:hypothetical protein